jgi:Protein of unknown function (DUF2752)
MGLYADIIDWLEHRGLECSFKKNLHLECPGCGFQSSLAALLKGHLAESFRLYPAAIPLLLVFLMTALHLVFKFKHGAAIIKYLFILSAILIFINFIHKIINQNLL